MMNREDYVKQIPDYQYMRETRCCNRVKSRHNQSDNLTVLCTQSCKYIRLIVILLNYFLYFLTGLIPYASTIQVTRDRTFCHPRQLRNIIDCHFISHLYPILLHFYSPPIIHTFPLLFYIKLSIIMTSLEKEMYHNESLRATFKIRRSTYTK